MLLKILIIQITITQKMAKTLKSKQKNINIKTNSKYQ